MEYAHLFKSCIHLFMNIHVFMIIYLIMHSCIHDHSYIPAFMIIGPRNTITGTSRPNQNWYRVISVASDVRERIPVNSANSGTGK